MRVMEIETFMRDYYEPHLLPRLLHGDRFPRVRPLDQLNRVQPLISIASEWYDPVSALAKVTVTVQAHDDPTMTNGKTFTRPYDLRVFRDGQIVGSFPAASTAWEDELSIDETATDANAYLDQWRKEAEIRDLDSIGKRELTFLVQVPRQPNLGSVTFTAYAFNEDRVKSPTADSPLSFPKSLQERRGNAYIVSVGVNRTESAGAWTLKYAAADARETSQIVGDHLRSTNQFDRVERIRLVSDERLLAEEATATKGHIRAVLDVLAGRRSVDAQLQKEIPGIEKFEKAQPEDLVLLFFSSHGYTDGRGVFHMVLSDIGAHTPQDRITAELQRRSLSSNQLSDWLRTVDAGEMVMIIDSCHSAATVEAEGFKPGPMGSRGLGQMAYDKGMRILAASKSEQSAVERDGIRHGLLTYALIDEGLSPNRTDFQPERGTITISEWLAYAEREVPGTPTERSQIKITIAVLIFAVHEVGRESQHLLVERHLGHVACARGQFFFDGRRQRQLRRLRHGRNCRRGQRQNERVATKVKPGVFINGLLTADCRGRVPPAVNS